MAVIHVSPVMPERMSGATRDEDMYALQAAGWRRRGHDVQPMPDDGQDHPVNKPCPVCS